MNLDQLEHLSLRGNKLSSLAEESFQVRLIFNIPKERKNYCFYFNLLFHLFLKSKIIFIFQLIVF